MKIIRLEVENVKRLVAVDITPDGYLQIIGGNNGQGKTSLLDAIWLVLTGATASKAIKKVVRDGEESAFAKVTLGDKDQISYIATRTWKADGTSTLKLESADGAKFSSPQDFLNGMLGKLAFDPLAFTRLKPDEQFDTLMGIVEIEENIEALDIKADKIYAERTEVGREVKSLQAQVDAIEVDPFAPEAEVNIGDLLERYNEAKSDEADKQLLKINIEETESEIKKLQEILASYQTRLANFPAIADTDALKAELDSAEENNAKFRRKDLRDTLVAKLTTAEDEQKAKSLALEQIAEIKKTALANAKFPIPGLSVEGKTVTYNGIPFDQIAESEKIKVSIAIGVALNPKINVMRISDGSLLDDASLAYIEEIAHEKDFQFWVEMVRDGGVGIIIEEGKVK
jgi:DNA repair exonuclease SbcCD ATPase subunit